MAKPSFSPREFLALQRMWYAKAAASGFEDIEDTRHPDRPLKEYHSFKFLREERLAHRTDSEAYQAQVDAFRNDPSFREVCRLVTKHKRCKFGAKDAQRVWELHCRGLSERKLAAELGCGAHQVHKLLVKMREWMRLL